MARTLDTLDFPPGRPFDIRQKDGGRQILDAVRRRFVPLTPEEWVRQHLIRTLVEHLGYPAGLIAIEPTITTVAGARRPDVVAFHRDRSPGLIAECKAPSVRITQDVFDQVSRYNVITLAPVLMVTNGREHFCWRVNRESRRNDFLSTIPAFAALSP